MNSRRSKRFPVILLTIFTLSFLTLFYRGDSASTKNGNPSLLAALITATKTGVLDTTAGGDLNGNGLVNPGDRLIYEVTINNGGPDPATGVNISDTIDANTTLVPSSVIASPVAVNDSYSTIGNVGINVTDGSDDLLGNDLDANNPGVNTALTFIQINGTAFSSGAAVATTNGSVKINSNGSFTYTPNPGFEGTDTFTYTLENGTGMTDTSTVSITVSGMIWFVNSAAATNGNGTLNSPFNCLTGSGCFSAAPGDEAGDNIFLYSGNYTGGITLLNNQRLIGQGASASLAGTGSITGITVPTFSNPLPSTGGANPVITTINVNAITLGAGNTIRGLTVGNTGSGTKIFGNGFGALTIGNTTAPDVALNGTGGALNLTNGSFAANSAFSSVATTSSPAQGVALTTVGGTAAFGSTTISGSASQGILVAGSTADINFGSTTIGTASAGTGGTNAVSLQNNSAGTRTFGTLTIQNTNGPANHAFLMANGGGNTVVGATNISAVAGTGNGIDIKGLAAGTSVSFGNTTVDKSASPGMLVNLGGTLAGEPNLGNVTFANLGGTSSTGSGLVGTNNTGQIVVTNNAGNLSANGGAAVNITGVSAASRTPINLNFASLSSSGGTNGVNLTNVSGLSGGGLSSTGGTIQTSTGTAFNVNTSSAIVNVASVINKTSSGSLVAITASTANITLSGNLSCTTSCTAGTSVTGNTGGTIAFSGGSKIFSTGANYAVHLTSNAGVTINFSNGGLDIDTTSGVGFNATDGATAVNVTTGTNANTIDSTTGTALNINATTIGASGLNFRSISSNGGGNAGIILNNTGATGSLIIAGNGGTCSSVATCTGGAIQNKTGDAISLTTTFSPSFNRMFIFNADNSGINGTDVTNATITNSFFDDIGTDFEDSAIAFNTNKVAANNIDGTLTVTGNTMTDLYYSGLDVQGGAGTITQATVSDNIITNTTNGFGINFVGSCTSTTCMRMDNADINHNNITGARGAGIQVITSTNNAGTQSSHFGVIGDNTKRIDVTNNSILPPTNGNHAIALATGGPNFGAGVRARMHFLVECNGKNTGGCSAYNNNGIGSGNIGHVILIGNNSNSDMVGTINNNKIVASQIAASGGGGISGGNGVASSGDTASTPDLTLTVTNNDISGTEGNGILLVGRGTNGTAKLGIRSNTVAAPTGGNRPGIRVDAGNNTAGSNDTICSDIRDNTSFGSGSGSTSSPGIGIRKEGTNQAIHSMGIEGLSPSPATQAQVESALTTLNPNSEMGGTSCCATPGGARALAISGGNYVSCGSAPRAQSASLFAPIETNTSDKTLIFRDASYVSVSKILAGIHPSSDHYSKTELISATEIVEVKASNETQAVAEIETVETEAAANRLNVSSFLNNASAVVVEITDKLLSSISPTVIAQESDLNNVKTDTVKTAPSEPESGENINRALGTLPAGENIRVQFKVAVDANIPSNDYSVSNQATVSGTNFINVLTDGDTVAAGIQPTVTGVIQPPSISKAFGAANIAVNGTTSLTFTISNGNLSQAFSQITFTDIFPSGLVIANPLTITNSCNGTLQDDGGGALAAGDTGIKLVNGSGAANGTCTITVNVTGTSDGTKNNTTTAISSLEGGVGSTSNTAVLNVSNPPTLTKSFAPNQIQLDGTSTLQFTLANPNSTLALDTLAFTDSLPAGVTAPNTAATTVCADGSYSIASNVISFTKPSLAAGANCQFSVTVTGATAGLKTNTTSTVTTANSGAGIAATANLTVIAPATIAKAFNPTSIAIGGTSTVTLTLSNSNTTGALTNASFTDTLSNMSAAGGSVGGTCTGTTPNTLAAGATNLSFGGITIPNNGSCTVIFAVTSTTAGDNPNTTSGITTAQTPTAGTPSNTATLTIVAPPQIAKSFSPNSVALNGISMLTISITNPSANTFALTGVGVTDTFPTGLEVDVTPNATNSCSTGTFAPVAGATSVSVSGATIPVNTTCTFSVKVKATTVGAKNNVTGNVTSTEGGAGGTAAATLTVINNSYEADLAPRPDGTGDGFVNPGDITQVRRFVAGLDLPYQSNEFQRVDSAPLNSQGDGFINAGDVTQVRRYAASLDAVQPAGGPTDPVPPPPVNNLTGEETKESVADAQIFDQEGEADVDKLGDAERANKVIAAPRELRPTRFSLVGNVLTVAVNLNTDAADAPANAVGFTLQFDTMVLSNPTNIRLGANAPAATTITENTSQAAMGRVGIVLDLPVSPAQTFPTGDAQLVLIDFTVAMMPPASTTLSFGDSPVQRFVGDINGNQLMTTFSSGNISLLPVTAASVMVGGRVVTTNGRGINKAVVTLTDQNGTMRQALTNPFGYYRFADVQAGQAVVLSVRNKQYQFNPIVLQVNEELTETNFVGFCVICLQTR